MYDAIIFDLGGTLIDSAPQIAQALNFALQASDIAPFTLPQVTGFIGNGLPVLIARAMAARGLADDALAKAIAARMLEVYETNFDATVLYPGVTELLDGVSHLPLGICTNKPARATAAVLRHFGLTDRFAVVVGGDSLPQRKPDPAPLHLSVRELNATRPLYVGDSEVDAATALAAALPFALFTGGYRHGPVAADLTFDHHADLLPMIRTTSGGFPVT